MLNEDKILKDFSDWLKKRQKEHNILTNLKMLTNNYGTGWEHWLKYELLFMLKEDNYKVESEYTVQIDGRGLKGQTEKRVDIAILCKDQPVHFFELKCGWLTEEEICK